MINNTTENILKYNINEFEFETNIFIRKKFIDAIINNKKETNGETFDEINKQIINIDGERQIPYAVAYLSDRIFESAKIDTNVSFKVNNILQLMNNPPKELVTRKKRAKNKTKSIDETKTDFISTPLL